MFGPKKLSKEDYEAHMNALYDKDPANATIIEKHVYALEEDKAEYIAILSKALMVLDYYYDCDGNAASAIVEEIEKVIG
jgi:hypothetical protein